MLLAGSSNCFEIGLGGRNGRRVRSWESFRYYHRKDKLSEKPEVIIKNVDAELRRCIQKHRGDSEATPKDIRNHFGYYTSLVVGSGHCGGTSFNQWRSVFSNGIRGALTIEELDKLGVNLVYSSYSYNETPDNGKPATVDVKTEREYFIELKKWRAWQANGGRSFSLSFRPSSTDRVLERLRSAKRKAPREKTTVEQDHYFVLTSSLGNLIKYTSRGYRYSYSETGGKQFMAEQDAEKYRQQLVAKGRHKADTWKVKRVDRATTFQV